MTPRGWRGELAAVLSTPMEPRYRQRPPGALRRATSEPDVQLFAWTDSLLRRHELLRPETARALRIRQDQLREQADVLIRGHLATGHLFHLQALQPLIRNPVQVRERAPGQIRN